MNNIPPKKPATTAKSATAAKPVAPVKPSTPTMPVKPPTAAKPLPPATPVKPLPPVTPVKPLTPATPVKPLTPATPVKPVTPAKPLTPATPVKPVTAAKPVTPATPVKPVTAAKPIAKPAEPPAPKARPKLLLREGHLVKDVAELMKMKLRDLLDKLGERGLALTANDLVDAAHAEPLARALGADVEFLTVEQEAKLRAESRPDELLPRPPVVTIMGHVDHGKTTLLDAIRSSRLVDKESGGITQHIGAYRVSHKNRLITFIDTPGHEAFTQLRARGARLTDIVVLVVAADDGVMPQTKEAINHAKAAGVPIIVAINKMDRPEANAERVKQQLSKEGLLVESWGGKIVSVEISAKAKENIDDLLEMIVLTADVAELKANPRVPAQGVVLEARLDAQKGPLATVIVQFGTLGHGESFVSGTSAGKVRALFDEAGKPIRSAGPSAPVEILGFSEVPAAGSPFQVVESQENARLIAQYRLSKVKKEEPVKPERVTLDELFRKIDEGKTKELPIVLKADVQGSVEVLRDVLPSLSSDMVKINLLHAATGAITEADVVLASASDAIVIGYNIKPNPKVQEIAKKENVEIRTYKIIYELTEDIKKAMVGMLEPVIREVYQGRAEVRRTFQIPKVGMIAGCYVTDGKIARNAEIRVMRNRAVIHVGRISSLKHVKENVTEVKKDYECGIALDKFHDVQQGDLLEAYVKEKVRAE
jgi:translation initiation factor IF-2